MNNIPNPILSICYPTFNRAERLLEVVDHALSFPSNEIEVLVSDNASKDGTQEKIKQISDPRLKYFRNKENVGLDGNLLLIGERATGEFLFVISDEDYVETSTLPWLIEQIKAHPEVNVIFGSLLDKRWGDERIYYTYSDKIYSKGEEALTKFMFSHSHLTGFIVRRSALNLEYPKQFGLWGYNQDFLYTYPMKTGALLTTSKIIATLGTDVKYAHKDKLGSRYGKYAYDDLPARLVQYNIRYKFIYDLAGSDINLRKKLLKREEELVAVYVSSKFTVSLHVGIIHFWYCLRIKECSKSPRYWVILCKNIGFVYWQKIIEIYAKYILRRKK